MNIGIVTTWFERGAAYVSRVYLEMLQKEGHNVFVFARGGKIPPVDIDKWNEPYVTRDTTYQNTQINKREFFKWINQNHIEVILFNEQQDFRIVGETKKKFPNVKLAAYVDYYTERTKDWFDLYDFVICNTHRHMQAMEKHPQKFYLQWGTDIDLYKPKYEMHDQVTFFHSVGMSTRKGTDILLDAFINGECYKQSKLVIHTQIPIERFTKYDRAFLQNHNVEIIEKTVTAPGLYFMGDVYVYPTRLDGLGLTMYEAAASGLPIITTDFPPMNEAVKAEFGRLIKVHDFYCRQDAYFFPMAICDRDDLIRCMRWYIDHPEKLNEQKIKAREYALAHYDIMSKSKECSDIFVNSKIRKLNVDLYKEVMRYYKKENNFVFQYSNNRTWIYNLKKNILSMKKGK